MQLVAAAMKPSIHSFCYVLLGFFLYALSRFGFALRRCSRVCACLLYALSRLLSTLHRFVYVNALSFLLRLPKLICELHRCCPCVSALSLLMSRRLIVLLANALPRLSCAPFHPLSVSTFSVCDLSYPVSAQQAHC